MEQIFINGEWREARASGSFRAENPATKQPLAEEYPVSSWEDCESALDAAVEAFEALRKLPRERIAQFLDTYASRIEARKVELVSIAAQETALPASPRLGDVELPRTTAQLRQAAAAARTGRWALPTIDTAANIRSCYAGIGPVCVFGPNNFPFAFGSVSGGDFAAAIAAGNPVIGKANSSHPGTTRIFAEEAGKALVETRMPPAMVQLLYRTSHANGERLVSDPRLGATGYTGSRNAGLKLKAAADQAGKPIYLELSSVNPVVILPGALEERADGIAQEFATSCLLGTGQFCTNPGLVILIEGEQTETFVVDVTGRFRTTPAGTLLSGSVERSLRKNLDVLIQAGAIALTGNEASDPSRYSVANTLLRVSGAAFLQNAAALQTEVFGNAALFVIARDLEETHAVLSELEGNLTGCIYSSTTGADDAAYARIEPVLRRKVGRLLNDKMPTGVAVSPAMNHGGPYPATGHPGFTAVGIPASIRRFALLQCYDAVRPDRLPDLLRDENSTHLQL